MRNNVYEFYHDQNQEMYYLEILSEMRIFIISWWGAGAIDLRNVEPSGMTSDIFLDHLKDGVVRTKIFEKLKGLGKKFESSKIKEEYVYRYHHVRYKILIEVSNVDRGYYGVSW
ncbi:MAG: hypothetical protein ACRCST_13515 [Turicibacter sp.]